MNLIFILFFASCMTSTRSYIKIARGAFPKGLDCGETMKSELAKSGCVKLLVDESSSNSAVIRCLKNDKDRGKFWDNWTFRITSAKIQLDPESFVEIRQHTICIDKNIRVEAYPPERLNIK